MCPARCLAVIVKVPVGVAPAGNTEAVLTLRTVINNRDYPEVRVMPNSG